MATRIRLKRTGSRHQPHFRVVVMDQRASRDGRAIEEIGYYNPRTEPATIDIEEERALHWLSKGAQPTETVARLLTRVGIMDKFNKLKETP